MKEKKKFSFTPEKLWGIAIFVFFAWFIFAFLVFPNLNTVVSVFYQNGHFTTEVFTKLVHSAKAMRSLSDGFVMAPHRCSSPQAVLKDKSPSFSFSA